MYTAQMCLKKTPYGQSPGIFLHARATYGAMAKVEFVTPFMKSTMHMPLPLFFALVSTAECPDPATLGMEDGTIPDARITASSFKADNYAARYSRLNNNKYWVPQRLVVWCLSSIS